MCSFRAVIIRLNPLNPYGLSFFAVEAIAYEEKNESRRVLFYIL